MKTSFADDSPVPGQNSPNGVRTRHIPKDHPYDPKSLKPMARMLWAMSVSLGHALTAYRQFTRLKSVTISPDGLIGGRGYVMEVKEVRQKLYEACEALSLISDTIHDEIKAPHWQPRLAQLDENDAEDISRFIEESQRLFDNPGDEPEEEMKAIEEENDPKGKAPKKKHPDDTASDVPGAGEAVEENHTIPKDKQASWDPMPEWRTGGNSSIPVNTLGGPRVDHIGPAEGQGQFGSYNTDEPTVDDDWGRSEGVGNEYMYPSEWAGKTNRTATYTPFDAASAVPDFNSEDTETEARDFGLGFGGKGQGTERPHGDGTGEGGSQHAGLPGGGSSGKGYPSDSTKRIERDVSVSRNLWAVAELPNDFEEPIARSDYYEGPKGGLVSQSTVPGDDTAVGYGTERDTPGVGSTFESLDNTYVKWDDSTKNYRSDTTYQRTARKGPHHV